jgi:hypothetical protein
MGQDVEAITYTREQRQRYRREGPVMPRRVRAHARLQLTSSSSKPMTGMEIELNLVGDVTSGRKMDNARGPRADR